MPEKEFDKEFLNHMPKRRLSGSRAVSETTALLNDIEQALDQAEAQSPAKARVLAKRAASAVQALLGAGA